MSREGIDRALDAGFELVQMARALVNDPAFVERLRTGDASTRSACDHRNYLSLIHIYALGALARRLVDQTDALSLGVGELLLDILASEGHVVDADAPKNSLLSSLAERR